MDLEAVPPLLAGEVLVLSNQCVREVCLFDDVLPRSGVLAPVGRSGTLWITNFRTILCFHVSDGTSIPLYPILKGLFALILTPVWDRKQESSPPLMEVFCAW